MDWSILPLLVAISICLAVVFYDTDKQRSQKANIYPQGEAASLAPNGQGVTLVDKMTGFNIRVRIVETKPDKAQVVVQDTHDVFVKPAGRSDIWIGSGTVYSRGVDGSDRFVVSWSDTLVLAS